MNDAVIERIAREDPAAGAGPGTAAQLLTRLRDEIDSADPPPARVPVRRRLGQIAAPVAAALVALAVAVAAAALLGHRARPKQPAAPRPPVSAVAVGSVHLAPGTEVVATHAGSLWVAGGHAVERLDPASGAVQASIQLPIAGIAGAVTFGAGGGWVAAGGGNTGGAPSLARLDPVHGRILATIEVTGSRPGHLRVLGQGIAFAAGRLWLSRDSPASHGDVISVNPATNRVDGRPVTVGTGPGTILAAFGSLWVDNTGRTVGSDHAAALPASVARIDPSTRIVTTEPYAGTPTAGFGSLWVRRDDTITRYDPSTNRAVARVRVPHLIAVASGDGRMWAVSGPTSTPDPNGPTATLTQIDPASNRIVGTPISLPAALPVGIAVSGHDLWIADFQSGLFHVKLTSR